MTIRERWQRIRAGKSSAGGMKTGDGNGKRLTSHPREKLPPINTAPPLRPHHRPQSSEETSGRSPNRNFLTRTLTWRFNNHNTIEGTSSPGQGEPRPLRREGGEKRHRRKPSKYPGRCSPPPLTCRPQLATSRSEPVLYPPPLRPGAGDNYHQHHHSAPPPQPQAQPQPQGIGTAIPTTQENRHPPSPKKKKKPDSPHHSHGLPISAAVAAAAAAAASSSLKRNRNNPKEKAARKKKGIRQRQREREREINRHIFGPEQQKHQELLNSYTFPVEPSPAEQRKKNMGKDGFLDDEGHDGDDEGYCAGAGGERHGERGQHRRKSSNVSPYSCSRPGSLSGSTVGGGAGTGTGATNMTAGMGGLSLGEMGMMGHWTRDLNGDGPWGGFEVSEDR